MESKDGLSRRSLLKGAAAAALLSGCSTAPTRDLIRSENEKPGTSDWMLSRTRPTRCRSPWLEGYCSRMSVEAGQSIEIKVSTNPPSPFVIDLYRMGYYGGTGGRFMGRLGPFRGRGQEDPASGEERLKECRWETSTTFEIPSDWPSGVYLGKMTEELEKSQSYIIFVVRDRRPADFLFQVSDTTWAAYNRWPDLWSLYDDGTPPHNWYVGPGVRVSFDRPYGKYRQILDAPLSQGSGEFLLWEFPLAYWMEREGYDVSYISNLDTHARPERLLHAKSFLSVAHDEYWSLDMYRNALSAIRSGVHAAFLSGNAVDGVIEILPNAAGAPDRTIGRIGQFGFDDPRAKRLEAAWKQHGPRPELLMGARTTIPANGGGDWTCVNDRHWLFGGTGMSNGQSIKGLVGWEHHGLPADLPGLEVLAQGPVWSNGKPQKVDYVSTVFPGPRGNTIFNAATIWWSLGLSEPPGFLRPTSHGNTPPGPDPRVQRITQNLFRRFLA